jgi:hypothetical protein
VADLAGVEQSTEVTAASLYEAVAAALASLRKDDWVGEIGTGLYSLQGDREMARLRQVSGKQ